MEANIAGIKALYSDDRLRVWVRVGGFLS